MLEILVVSDGDQRVKVFSGELVLETDVIIATESGELGHHGTELDVSFNGKDFGIAADVSELVVVLSGLDFAAITAHELDFVVGEWLVP